MKKFFFAFASLTLGAGIACAGEPSITILDDQLYYGGLMPECVSANGLYVSGSSYSWAGFVASWQGNQDIKVYMPQDGVEFQEYGCSLPYVNNEGIALGYDDLSYIKINFPAGKIERLPIDGINEYADYMTQDGNILVGMTRDGRTSDFKDPHVVAYQACYWENGERHLLPVPTEEELGYYYLYTHAISVSADGSVILGAIVDRLYQNPMILWFRQPDGSYKLDAVCEKYFSDIKYNEGYYKEYVQFKGNALSANGKWVCMTLRTAPEYNKPADSPEELALYNTETGEIKKAVVTEDLNLRDNGKFNVYINGISDNGTIVGSYDSNIGISAFIMYPDDMKIVNFIDAFDTIGAFQDYEEEGGNSVSCITPDGGFICGYGYKNDEFEGYVFATELAIFGDSGIEAIGKSDSSAPLYYNLQGQHISNPSGGIFVKVTGGKAEKLLIGK